MRSNRTIRNNCKGVGAAQQMKLCDRCGGVMVNKWDVLGCTACRSTTFELVYETDAADYRMNKMTEREEASQTALKLTEEISRFFSEDMFILWLNTAPSDPFDFLDYAQAEANRILAECFEPDDFLREPTDAELREIEAEEEAANDLKWLIGDDVIFGSKEWFINLPDEPTNSPAPDGAGTGE